MWSAFTHRRWSRGIGIIISLFLIAPSALGSAGACEWTDDTQTALLPGGETSRVGASDHWVIWAEKASPDDPADIWWNIQAFNLENLTASTAVTDVQTPGLSLSASLDAGLLAWIEPENDGALRALDLATGERFQVANRVYPWSVPSVSGSTVAWHQVAENGEHQILVRDLKGTIGPVVLDGRLGTETSGAFPPVSHPILSGDFVVWQRRSDASPNSTSIMYANLQTGEQDVVEANVNANGGFDFENGLIVYGTPGDFEAGIPGTITMIDLPTWTWHVFDASVMFHEGGFPIETDGRFVLWVNERGHTYGYDRLLDSSFVVPVNRFAITIDGGMLTWLRPQGNDMPVELHRAPAEDFSSGRRSRYFPETDRWLGLDALKLWDASGGLPIFGYPVTYDGVWLEQARVEWHPENDGTPYETLLGRLGWELAQQQGVLGSEPFRYRTDQEGPDAGCIYVRETGHYICDAFRFTWESHGLDLGDPGISRRESIALFGYPISEPFMTTNADADEVYSQYFERAVFELHPDEPFPHRVQLRRLGVELKSEHGW